MKKRASIVLLSLCMVFSMLLVGCNKSENTNETNNEPTQESETDQGNETTNESETPAHQALEPKTVDQFTAMLVKEGMLKKASELEAKTYSEYHYYRGYITAPKMVSKKDAETMTIMLFYDKDTNKVEECTLSTSKETEEEKSAYKSHLKQSLKVIMKFMNSAMTQQQLEEMVNALDTKGETDQGIAVDDKYGLYFYSKEDKDWSVQVLISYTPIPKAG